jgi:tubulin monoglycylase TTLL3/8
MIDTNLKMWLIEVNKCPCMAYSTAVTRTLIPRFMEDMAKVLVDKKMDPEAETGELQLILEFPAISEPKEIRSAEEFTVLGKRMIEKKK